LRFYQKERQEFDRAAENRRGCGVAQDWLAQPETGIEKIFNGEYVATSHQAKSQERNWLGQVCGAGLRKLVSRDVPGKKRLKHRAGSGIQWRHQGEEGGGLVLPLN
jgi:ribosomal protein L34E